MTTTTTDPSACITYPDADHVGCASSVECSHAVIPSGLTVEAAESLTEAIRKAGANFVTARKSLEKAIREAKEGNAHTVLGFASWTSYVAHVFSADAMPRMAKADLTDLAGFMAGEGMSSRTVADALGVSQATASRMIRAARPEGEDKFNVTGADGKTYTLSVAEKKARAKKADKPETSDAGEGSGDAGETVKADPLTSALARLQSAASALESIDLGGMTVSDIDGVLSDLADTSALVKRFAARLGSARKVAPVDSPTE